MRRNQNIGSIRPGPDAQGDWSHIGIDDDHQLDAMRLICWLIRRYLQGRLRILLVNAVEEINDDSRVLQRRFPGEGQQTRKR